LFWIAWLLWRKTGKRASNLTLYQVCSSSVFHSPLYIFLIADTIDLSTLYVTPPKESTTEVAIAKPSIDPLASPDKIISILSDPLALNTPSPTLNPIKGTKQVQISRRRKTTSGDFDKALSSLRQDSLELDKACLKAQELTALSAKSVESFKAALANTSSQTRRETTDKSTPIGLFKWAVRRVILQNTVVRVRQELEIREKRGHPMRVNATFPSPDNISMDVKSALLNRAPLLEKIHENHSNGSPTLKSSPSPSPSPSAPAHLSASVAATPVVSIATIAAPRSLMKSAVGSLSNDTHAAAAPAAAPAVVHLPDVNIAKKSGGGSKDNKEGGVGGGGGGGGLLKKKTAAGGKR
jgi:hypothetical protein